MPIPLIPIILGAAVGTSVAGYFKGNKAIENNSKANDINEQARRLQENITRKLQNARDKTKKQLENLGRKKLHVCEVTIGKFVMLYEIIKNINLSESNNIGELDNFKIDNKNLNELKEINILASSFTKESVADAMTNSAIAFGAYSAARAFVHISTGAAITGFSSAATTNTTLAFLGGGALAVSSMGMIGGMSILGSVVAGPALLAIGTIMGVKANQNLINAYSNLSKVREAEIEVNDLVATCNEIANRANLITSALDKLNIIVVPKINNLSRIIKEEGTDYSKYSATAHQEITTLLSLIKVIKTILDTAILTDEGALTEESRSVLEAANQTLAKFS